MAGVTIDGAVFLARRKYLMNTTVMVHEGTHVSQQLELGWWNFLARFVAEFIWRLVKKPWAPLEAYRGISFEVEARASEP